MRFLRAIRELARPLDRDVAQDRRVHELVDQPDLERLLRADVLPRQDHVQRCLQPDGAWQPLRASRTGEQADLHLRKREDCLRVVGRDAPCAGQGRFESAAEARAVYGGDNGCAKGFEPVEQRVTLATHRFRLRGGLPFEELLDVGAGDERVRLATDQDSGADGRVGLELLKERDEVVLDAAGDDVDRLAGRINRDDRQFHLR